MDYMVRATSQDSGSEVRMCATRTDVENFIIEKLRECLSADEDVLFHITREN